MRLFNVSKRAGISAENHLKHILQGKGFYVTRAPASKGVDLVCLKDGRACLIECKSSKRPIFYFGLTGYNREQYEELKAIEIAYRVNVWYAFLHNEQWRFFRVRDHVTRICWDLGEPIDEFIKRAML